MLVSGSDDCKVLGNGEIWGIQYDLVSCILIYELKRRKK